MDVHQHRVGAEPRACHDRLVGVRERLGRELELLGLTDGEGEGVGQKLLVVADEYGDELLISCLSHRSLPRRAPERCGGLIVSLGHRP